jgi:hypothetical protein
MSRSLSVAAAMLAEGGTRALEGGRFAHRIDTLRFDINALRLQITRLLLDMSLSETIVEDHSHRVHESNHLFVTELEEFLALIKIMVTKPKTKE